MSCHNKCNGHSKWSHHSHTVSTPFHLYITQHPVQMKDSFYDTPAPNLLVASHFTPSKSKIIPVAQRISYNCPVVTVLMSPPTTHFLLLLQNSRQAPTSVSLQSLFPLPGKLLLRYPSTCLALLTYRS